MVIYTPGKPTPNPKYKTGQDAKKAQENLKGSSQQTQAATPPPGSSIGGQFPTEADKIGYADASVSQIKEGSAQAQGGRVVYSTTYKGGSGQIQNAAGQTVAIQQKEASSYANVNEARKEAIKNKQGAGLSNQQLQEYEAIKRAEAPKKVAVDYAAVDRLNREVSFEDLKNAKLQDGKILIEKKVNSSQDLSFVESQKAQVFPSRTVAPGETTPREQEIRFENPFPEVKYGGVMQAAFVGPERPSNQSIIFEIDKSLAETKVNARYLPVEVGALSLAAADVGEGFLETTVKPAYSFITSPVETTKATAKFIVDVASNPIQAGVEAATLVVERPAYTLGLIGGVFVGGKVLEKVSPVKAKVEVDKNLPGLAKYKGLSISYPAANVENVLTIVYEPKKTRVARGVEVIEADQPVKVFENLNPSINIERQTVFIESPAYSEFLKTREGELYKQFQDVEISFTPPSNEKPLVSSKTGRTINTFKQPVEPEGGSIELASGEKSLDARMREKGYQFNVKTGEYENTKSTVGSGRFSSSEEPSTDGGGGGGGMENPLDFTKGVDLQGEIFPDLSGRKQKLILIEPEQEIVTVRPFSQAPGEIPVRAAAPIRIVAYSYGKNEIIKTVTNPLKIESQSAMRQELQVKSQFMQSQTPATLSKESLSIQTQSKAKSVVASVQSQNIMQASAQAQAQSQAVAQAQNQVSKVVNIQRVAIGSSQVTPPVFARPVAKEPTKRKSKLVEAQVRRKGIFQTVGTSTEASAAQFIGERVAENTAGASFRLKQDEQILQVKNRNPKFYESQREPGVVIQKNKFRINTPGEKAEITFLGQRTQQARRKVKNIFGG